MKLTLLKPLVRLDLLEAVRPELLTRFLRPFEGYLAARGIVLGGSTDLDWVSRLHQVLSTVDAEAPADLQQALLDIADLTSTDDAHENVLTAARDQQLGLFAVNPTTTPEDLAFEVYLDHRDVFRAAHARVQTADVKRFVEFVAKDDTQLVGAVSASKQVLLSRMLGSWFRQRNRTAFCDVRVCDSKDEISIVVIHGRPPRNQGAIESDDRRTRVAFVPDKHDVIVYDRRRNSLGVNAQFLSEQDYYRRAIGEVLWNDPEHFVAKPVLSGQPLEEQGSAVLDPHGVPGLQEVILREIRLVSQGKDGGVASFKAHDLRAFLDSPFGRLALEFGKVDHFKLSLVLTGRPRPLQVEVHVPNDLSFDRQAGAEIVHEYLLESGFMQMPAVQQRAA
jgi:hypothetical protein